MHMQTTSLSTQTLTPRTRKSGFLFDQSHQRTYRGVSAQSGGVGPMSAERKVRDGSAHSNDTALMSIRDKIASFKRGIAPKELADILGGSESTVSRQVKAGMPCGRFGVS